MPSKLGPHCLNYTREAEQMVTAGTSVVKLVADFTVAERWQAQNPNLTVVGRGYEGTYNLYDQYHSGMTPGKAAERFVNDQWPKYWRPHPMITLWEGHNEPSFGSPNEAGAIEAMNWYGEYEAARLRMMAELGLRGVVGNFSTGYPEVKNDHRMWEAFLPAIRAAARYNGMLGVHEYTGPFMWWLTGKYQFHNCDGVIREDAGHRGWLTLRYRWYYELIFKKYNLHHVPLVITEAGMDAVGGPCPGAWSGAWQDIAPYWLQHDGADDPIDYWRNGGRDTGRYYAEQLIWYDMEMQKDPYVVGATIFSVGFNDEKWRKYDIIGPGSVVPRLLTHIAEMRNVPSPGVEDLPGSDDAPVDGGSDAPVDDGGGAGDTSSGPPEIANPVPQRGWPRLQYSRVYVLLPPSHEDADWVAAIARASWSTMRFSIGGSADDAGIGNLHARAVVAINPDAWGSEPTLEQWLLRYYRGARFLPVYASSPAVLERTLRGQIERGELGHPLEVRQNAPEVQVGQPRSQYHRRYVLFNPQQTTPDWLATVAAYTWSRFRLTMGGSSDDAGVGDLAHRDVYAINPVGTWGGDLAAWFQHHYPGVRLHEVNGPTADIVAQNLLHVLQGGG